MTDKQQEVFEEVGLNPKELQKRLKEQGSVAVIQALEQIKKAVPAERMNEYLGVMFGDEASIAIAPMMKNLENFKGALDLVAKEENYLGGAHEEAQTKAAATSAKLGDAMRALSEAAASLGKNLAPIVAEIAMKVTELLNKANAWIQANPKLAGTLIKVGLGAGVVVTAISGLVFGLAGVIGVGMKAYNSFLLLQKGFLMLKGSTFVTTLLPKIGAGFKAAAAGIKAAGLAVVSNPIVLAIAAAVAALAACVYWSDELAAGWDWLKTKIAELWSSFSEKFPIISQIVLGAFGPIITIVKTSIDTFMGLIQFLKAVFTGEWASAWQILKDTVVNLFNGLSDIILAPFKNAMGMINAVKNSGVGKSIGGAVSGAVQWGKGLVGLADGGVVSKPTLAMVGEGGESEAVIPLSKLEKMGGAGGQSMSVNFAPVINLSGGNGDYNGVTKALNEGRDAFKRDLERLMRDQRRVAFG